MALRGRSVLLVTERDDRNWGNISLEVLVSVKTLPRARGPLPPPPLSPVLHRMRSIASPGVTCCRGNSLYTATLCYHSLPESIKHHEIRNIKRTRTMSDPTERNLIEMLFFSTICFKFLRIHIANFVALKYYSF